MRELESAEFIWEEVIVYGHYQVWVAPPNGGKTTIAKQAAIDLGDQGVEVIYAQFDSGGPELKEFFKESAEHGVKLVSNIRKDPRKFVYDLLDAVERGWDPKKSVLFIDTLKKAAKTMSKDAMEEFGIAIRALTQKGLTVICLPLNLRLVLRRAVCQLCKSQHVQLRHLPPGCLHRGHASVLFQLRVQHLPSAHEHLSELQLSISMRFEVRWGRDECLDKAPVNVLRSLM